MKPPPNKDMIVHSTEGGPPLDCPPQLRERRTWTLREEVLACQMFSFDICETGPYSQVLNLLVV